MTPHRGTMLAEAAHSPGDGMTPPPKAAISAPHSPQQGPLAWPLEPPHLPKVHGQFADFP